MKNYLHPHYCNVLTSILSFKVWTLVNYIFSYWWKIDIGKKCKFKGKMIFRTLPDTTIKIGNGCTFLSNHRSNLIGIFSPCMFSTIKTKAIIEIGDNCGFSGTIIGCSTYVKLGSNVRCGANTMITDTDWHSDDYRTGKNKEVIIEDNVWLGYGVKVLKGVHIGKNSLIGVNSVVTKDIPANVIAAGNPCKVIKQIEPQR